ncbi:hypothetical protein PHLCEN_2v11901 [Hermanssonia centrifuga]|uniref:Oxidase ustYa n=1 Tax=Hermanssonia centrifuga TaxID=98765 RepID=A0A2R6NIL9_9APHY|nr:hypothetical protein PHLCEN_2v11901 [Hermanssonia centrifuga]
MNYHRIPSAHLVLAERSYSYTGETYPLFLPIPPLAPVAISLHESVRFALNSSDAVADGEWDSLSNDLPGLGRMRLGPERRVFAISMFHQLHCLRELQRSIVHREDTRNSYHHVQHCLNYLRQSLLCTAADTIEPGDPMLSDFETGGVGPDLGCQDWEKVFDAIVENKKEFDEWNSRWN